MSTVLAMSTLWSSSDARSTLGLLPTLSSERDTPPPPRAQEGVVGCDEAVLSELITQSEGDMRRAIQMLQSAHRLHGDAMTPQSILDISGAVPIARVADVFAKCRANDFDAMADTVADLLADGYPTAQFITQLLDYLIANDTGLANMPKAKLAMALAEADKQIVDGASDYLQLMNVLATLTRQLAAKA
eukprot:6177170-Pleurochrysis_carterae.AAC.3